MRAAPAGARAGSTASDAASHIAVFVSTTCFRALRASRWCSAPAWARRRRWLSLRCSSRPIRRCACRPGAATVASPMMSMRWACCCCAWCSAARRWRSWTNGAIIRRKLEMGTYAALAGDDRLPPIIGDLVRGMLAEDPEHRPTPTLLLDPASARGRRVAARPPRRAQQPDHHGGRRDLERPVAGLRAGDEPEAGVQRGAERSGRAMAAARAGRRRARRHVWKS